MLCQPGERVFAQLLPGGRVRMRKRCGKLAAQRIEICAHCGICAVWSAVARHRFGLTILTVCQIQSGVEPPHSKVLQSGLIRMCLAMVFGHAIRRDVPAAIVARLGFVKTGIAVERPAVEELLQP